VDLSRAFDIVDHATLLNKLSSIGLSSDARSWFHDYLSDRTQAIVIYGFKSKLLKVSDGSFITKSNDIDNYFNYIFYCQD
jgi:cobalamin biosynthesis protein CbiD